jgi:hypothetical protein
MLGGQAAMINPVSDNAHIIPGFGFNGNTRASGGCVTPS